MVLESFKVGAPNGARPQVDQSDKCPACSENAASHAPFQRKTKTTFKTKSLERDSRAAQEGAQITVSKRLSLFSTKHIQDMKHTYGLCQIRFR